MATLQEIHELFGNRVLLDKVEGACVITAEGIRVEDGGTANHPNRLIWAKQVFRAPEAAAKPMLMALLAANKDLDVGDADRPGTILGATGDQIQAKVDAAVDVFADGS